MATNGENKDEVPEERSVFDILKDHVIEHKIGVTIWLTRLLTIVFTLLYFMPILGSTHSSYTKALLANAATSALRLHQRHPIINLNLEFVSSVLREDSCHYFAYSMIFLFVAPSSLPLLPVFLFAVIHCASYSLILLDLLGQNSWWGARLLISLVELQSTNILNLIAFVEIILMPYCIYLILTGQAGFLTLFVYYQFLMMRCKSQRNPSTRNLFIHLTAGMTTYAHSSSTPHFMRKMICSSVGFLHRIFPLAQPQQ